MQNWGFPCYKLFVVVETRPDVFSHWSFFSSVNWAGVFPSTFCLHWTTFGIFGGETFCATSCRGSWVYLDRAVWVHKDKPGWAAWIPQGWANNCVSGDIKPAQAGPPPRTGMLVLLRNASLCVHASGIDRKGTLNPFYVKSLWAWWWSVVKAKTQIV